MSTNKKLAIDFINTYFNLQASWTDIAPYVEGEGVLTHPLMGTCTIHDGYNALHGPFLKSFPDIGHVIQTAGDTDSGQVFVGTLATGTFRGEWAGHQPNGKRWEIPASFLLTFKNGKITRVDELESHHMINDQLGIHLFKSAVEA